MVDFEPKRNEVPKSRTYATSTSPTQSCTNTRKKNHAPKTSDSLLLPGNLPRNCGRVGSCRWSRRVLDRAKLENRIRHSEIPNDGNMGDTNLNGAAQARCDLLTSREPNAEADKLPCLRSRRHGFLHFHPSTDPTSTIPRPLDRPMTAMQPSCRRSS